MKYFADWLQLLQQMRLLVIWNEKQKKNLSNTDGINIHMHSSSPALLPFSAPRSCAGLCPTLSWSWRSWCWSWSWCWCWRWMWLMVLQGLISNIRLLRLWPDIPAMQPIKSFTNLFQIISLTQPKVLSDKENNDDKATWWSSTLPPPHPSWWPRLHPMRGDHLRRIWEERLSRGEDLSKEVEQRWRSI